MNLVQGKLLKLEEGRKLDEEDLLKAKSKKQQLKANPDEVDVSTVAGGLRPRENVAGNFGSTKADDDKADAEKKAKSGEDVVAGGSAEELAAQAAAEASGEYGDDDLNDGGDANGDDDAENDSDWQSQGVEQGGASLEEQGGSEDAEDGGDEEDLPRGDDNENKGGDEDEDGGEEKDEDDDVGTGGLSFFQTGVFSSQDPSELLGGEKTSSASSPSGWTRTSSGSAAQTVEQLVTSFAVSSAYKDAFAESDYNHDQHLDMSWSRVDKHVTYLIRVGTARGEHSRVCSTSGEQGGLSYVIASWAGGMSRDHSELRCDVPTRSSWGRVRHSEFRSYVYLTTRLY